MIMSPFRNGAVNHAYRNGRIDSCWLKLDPYYTQLPFCSSCCRVSFCPNGQALMGHTNTIVCATYVALIPGFLLLLEGLHS